MRARLCSAGKLAGHDQDPGAGAGGAFTEMMATRYWAYLFENLERTISEIYDTCEKQDSILQCKEVLQKLDNYNRDFVNLIEWLNLKFTYEQTPLSDRPAALDLEIRKPSFSSLTNTCSAEKVGGVGMTSLSPPLQDIPKLKPWTDSTSNVNSPACPPLPVLVPKSEPEPEAEPSLPVLVPVPVPEPERFLPVFVVPTPEPAVSEVVTKIKDPVVTTTTEVPAPASPSEAQTQPQTPLTIEIGLQTELEEDPDIYYFAGGRHVASQTDYDNEEYGPLELFEAGGSSSVKIVFAPSEHNLESGEDTSEVAATARVEDLQGEGGSSDPPVRPKASTGTLFVGPTTTTTLPLPSPSSTGATEGTTPSPEVTRVENLQGPGTGTFSAPPAPVPVRPKTSTGTLMVRPNLPSAAAVVAGALRGKTSDVALQPRAKYRSNIASRFRTAVNTGQPHPTTSSTQTQVLPSPKHCSSVTAVAAGAAAAATCTAAGSGSGSGSGPSPLKAPLSHHRGSSSGIARGQVIQKLKQVTSSSSQNLSQSRPPSASEVNVKVNPNSVNHVQPVSAPGPGPTNRAGVSRSKSMINPVGFNNRGGRGGGKTWSFDGRRPSIPLPQTKSFASLPDETLRRCANSKMRANNIDEDGWETVRNRSNRSKYSPSTKSIESIQSMPEPVITPQLTELAAPKPQPEKSAQIEPKPKHEPPKPKKTETTTKPKPKLKPEEPIPPPTTELAAAPSPTPKPAESAENTESLLSSAGQQPQIEPEMMDGAADEDEIKRNEAALDIAIREEELLEEQLLEMEKDFEAIENQSTHEDPDDMSISESEKLISSHEVHQSRDFELELASSVGTDNVEEKFNRYVELSHRFESLNASTKRLVEERAVLIVRAEERRKRAAEKRMLYLNGIKMKAHDEDSKLKEIAFINLLEAQNKRHDYLTSAQEIESRLNMREGERRLRLEERGTKANAVLKRQFTIRNNWESKLKEVQEKRRRNEERITREKEEKAKERSDLAHEKARDREERLSALNAAKQAEKEELQKKIQQRQEDTARRHEENIEQIRQKAIELSAPRTAEDGQISVRFCTLCEVTMQSEVQELAHLRGRAHLDAVKRTEKDTNSNSSTSSQFSTENFGIKFITDVQMDKLKPGVTNDKNRVKGLRKHCKKLLLKLEANGLEFEAEEKATRVDKTGRGEVKMTKQVQKNLKEISRLTSLFSSSKGTPHLASTLDRLLTETRKLAVKNRFVQDALIGFGAFGVAAKLLDIHGTDVLPTKVMIGACHFLIGSIYNNLPNTLYVLRSTCMCSIVEFAAARWNALIPDDNRWRCGSPLGAANEPLPMDLTVEASVELLFNVLNIVPDPFNGIKKALMNPSQLKAVESRTLDIIGYLIGSGVIDRLSVYCSSIRGPVDDQPSVADLLKASLDLITMLVYALQLCWDSSKPDTTQFLAALESSELGGSLAMSYSLLLHQGAPTRPRQSLDDDAELVALTSTTTMAADSSTLSTSTTALQEISNKNLNGNGSSSSNKNDTKVSTTTATTAGSGRPTPTHTLAALAGRSASTSPTPPPPPPPPGLVTGAVVKSTISLINAVAHLDIHILQRMLGSEAMSLQFRHIVSQLLWQVVPHRTVDILWARLLNELLMAIGNFTVLNKQNQTTIQSGQTPTILQQLCCVPDEFFDNPELSRAFFPTLIACTYGCSENQAVLVQENIDPEFLNGFLSSEFARRNFVTKRILAATLPTHENGNENLTPPPPPSNSKKSSKKSHPKVVVL